MEPKTPSDPASSTPPEETVPSKDPSSPAPDPTKTPATPPKGDDSAKPDGDTVSKAEYDELKSRYDNALKGRDRSNEANRERNEFIDQIASERYIDSFLEENKKKFPDLKRDDLMHVFDPDQMDAEATRLQARLSKHAQDKLLEIEQPGPTMTQQQVKEVLDQEKANPNSNSLDRFLAHTIPNDF